MKILSHITVVVLIAVAILSCSKIETLPDTPHIEFRSFAVFDTTDLLGNDCQGGRLNFYFEDGDGDIGLYSPDYILGDSVNLFFTLYRKTEGIFSEVPENDLMNPSDYRIPYMERTGQNKILKGIISVTFLYLFYSPEDSDTVKYEFYIKDRGQHISDTAVTSEIALSVNNIYL